MSKIMRHVRKTCTVLWDQKKKKNMLSNFRDGIARSFYVYITSAQHSSPSFIYLIFLLNVQTLSILTWQSPWNFMPWNTCGLNICGSVHHAFVVKIIPRCNNCGLFFANAFYSTCFGWQSHPSSGVHVLYMATGKQAHCKLTRAAVITIFWA